MMIVMLTIIINYIFYVDCINICHKKIYLKLTFVYGGDVTLVITKIISFSSEPS